MLNHVYRDQEGYRTIHVILSMYACVITNDYA